MGDEKDIPQNPILRNIGKINVQKQMAELQPEHPFIDLSNATDEQIEAAIDEVNQKGYSLNLNIPATPQVIDWFFEELFKCEHCGKCCRGDFQSARKDCIPVLEEDIIQIAGFLKVRPRKIKKLCRTNSHGGLSLPYPCPFYNDVPKPNCSVYSVRPLTCRYFPLYSALAYEGLNEKLNDKPLLTIDAECPQAKKAALQIFRLMRNAAQNQ
ncbi:hypothetical protein ES708_25050 [subsurface metagenome]